MVRFKRTPETLGDCVFVCPDPLVKPSSRCFCNVDSEVQVWRSTIYCAGFEQNTCVFAVAVLVVDTVVFYLSAVSPPPPHSSR